MVGRARHVGPSGIALLYHPRQHLARDQVVRRIVSTPHPDVIALVIATPHDERGVVAQLAHHRLRLMADPLQELRALRVARAGKSKVLPHHHAVRVAKIEKGVVLIDAPAPGAHHVAAEVIEKR